MGRGMSVNFDGAVTVTAGPIVKAEPRGCCSSFSGADSALTASQVTAPQRSVNRVGVVFSRYALVTSTNIQASRHLQVCRRAKSFRLTRTATLCKIDVKLSLISPTFVSPKQQCGFLTPATAMQEKSFHA